MFAPIAYLHLSTFKPYTTHISLIHSDEGLTLETSAFNFSTVANLPLVINSVDQFKFFVFYFHTDAAPIVSFKTNPFIPIFSQFQLVHRK